MLRLTSQMFVTSPSNLAAEAGLIRSKLSFQFKTCTLGFRIFMKGKLWPENLQIESLI